MAYEVEHACGTSVGHERGSAIEPRNLFCDFKHGRIQRNHLRAPHGKAPLCVI